MTTVLAFATSSIDPAAIARVFAAVAWVPGVAAVRPLAPGSAEVTLRQMGTVTVGEGHDPLAVAAAVRALHGIAYCEPASARGPA